LTEKVKGNSDAVKGMSLDNLLDGHLSMYERSSTRHKLISRNASLNEGSASDDEGIAGEVVGSPEEMKRSCPVPSSNHAKTAKSQRERSPIFK
jgi:hypothetical protein